MDGALLCIRACWEHMAARGGGSIVNQSSTAAWMYANYYGLAKTGINGITHPARARAGRLRHPDQRDRAGTDRHRGRPARWCPGSIMDDIVEGLAIKRQGTPADLAAMCLFLLSDEASWITGQIIDVDGGQVVRA